MIRKIISGGQTGADMGGVAAGLRLGLETGGWVPKGRRTDAGPMNLRRFMQCKFKEHTSPHYPPRTRANVKEADGTVIFGRTNSPGCRLTISLCEQYGKPFLVNPTAHTLRGWAKEWKIRTLNVAGNRERTNPGIYMRVYEFLVEALQPDLLEE